jgi:hypothetical protein
MAAAAVLGAEIHVHRFSEPLRFGNEPKLHFE